jgi:hypothetical protein
VHVLLDNLAADLTPAVRDSRSAKDIVPLAIRWLPSSDFRSRPETVVFVIGKIGSPAVSAISDRFGPVLSLAGVREMDD